MAMKGPEHVLLFCTVIMAERRKEYPRPSRGRITARLELVCVKRHSSRRLRPDPYRVIGIVRRKPGCLDLIHRKISCKLMHDRSDDLKMRQFFGTYFCSAVRQTLPSRNR